MQKLFFISMGILLFAACNSNHQAGNIKLNNGEKWQVNAEMRPHIQQASKMLDDYLAQKNTDYKQLAEGLKNQNDQLIKSCTMKGENHDELHKWLHPHMGLVGKLADAGEAKEAEAIVAQIEQSFKTYHEYFK